MIRKLLIAATLLTATTAAMAHGDSGYGRVVSVEPRVSISFGTGYYDGFRVLYESGGRHYWTSTPYRPGPVIVVPTHYRVHHVHHHGHHDRWDSRRDRDDHRDWRGDRHERRDERRHHRY
jgi:hypothetical protein